MWIIAAVACAALMVSCGGEKKGADVVAKAKDYEAKVTAAYEAGDYEKAEKIQKEAAAWFEGLSEADQEKVVKAGM